jgi:uncharacterized protein (DUF1501 family)
MTSPSLSRRNFLMGCSAAVAAMSGARLNYVAFGSPEGGNQEMMVVIFLRGGTDGLSIVAPWDGADRGLYQSARPNNMQIPTTGANPGIQIGSMAGATGNFAMHPAMAPLQDLFTDQKLALIHGAGLNNDTRSHFDAMAYMERGSAGSGGLSTGWLTRHLQSASNIPDDIVIPALAVGGGQPTSLLGANDTISMSNPDDFSFYGHWYYGNQQRAAMRRMYTGNTWMQQAGMATMDAVDIVEYYLGGEYTPANGAAYPDTSFGRQLQVLAQVIKANLGMRVATLDLGGWDTHEYQGVNTGGYFSNLLGQVAQGLSALYTDLSGSGTNDYNSRLTVVTMSEFGRRLRANESGGTDHGHGNVMMVMGGNVTGGLKGTWPGLNTEQLYDQADLAITTDYRRVLSEILIRRLGNPNLGTIFPQYANYQPLGIVSGTDLPPIYNPQSPPTPTPVPGPSPTPDPSMPYDLYAPLIRSE